MIQFRINQQTCSFLVWLCCSHAKLTRLRILSPKLKTTNSHDILWKTAESTNVSKALFTLDLTWTQPLTPALPAEQVGVRIPFLYICIPLSDCEIGFIDVQKCWQRRLRATGGSHIQVQPQSVLKVGLNELQMCFHACNKNNNSELYQLYPNAPNCKRKVGGNVYITRGPLMIIVPVKENSISGG